MNTLSNEFTRNDRHYITIVGCGGTGGFVAEGLCRLLPVNIAIVLIDYDRVEERNLIRQNFFREDLGKLKSEALARRLSTKYNRQVAYSTLPVAMTPIGFNSVVVGCVDNGNARKDIVAHFKGAYGDQPAWWIDSGNGDNFGQILIGNSSYKNSEHYALNDGSYNKWPLPSLQLPEILRQTPVQRNCEDTPDQGPTINQTMAALVIEVVRRILAGTCSWVQLYVDMELGTLRPVYATQELLHDLLTLKNKEGG